MDLILFVIGIFLLVFGLINILLGWRCYDAEALSWLIFIGGIIFTIAGYIVEEPFMLVVK